MERSLEEYLDKTGPFASLHLHSCIIGRCYCEALGGPTLSLALQLRCCGFTALASRLGIYCEFLRRVFEFGLTPTIFVAVVVLRL